MNEVSVRGVADGDLEAVHEILTSPHVLAGSMRLPRAALARSRERLEAAPGTYQLVAESEGQVVGFGELITHPEEPRQSHVGEINMVATRAEWRGRGVGRTLVGEIVELADDWLKLERLQLIVFTDNAPAIGLYGSFGFKLEGTMPRLGFGAGEWMDAHMLGRLREG